MHFAFIPYGMKDAVEKLLRDMSAQKHLLKTRDKNNLIDDIWLESQIRILPFGVYEYVFPKEDLNMVLSTIGDENFYYIGKTRKKILRKILGYKPIPKFKKGSHYLWQKENVAIIPLGIKEDREIFDEKIQAWHEGL
jgi:hypothetical protein